MKHSLLLARRRGKLLLALCLAATAADRTLVNEILRQFLETDPRACLSRLASQRAPAVPPEAKRQILKQVPREGRVQSLRPLDRAKLDSLQTILRAHGRESVYDVMIIDVPQATAALHERVLVLISEPALHLLDAQELQAVVAHEVAHEYVWDQFRSARKDKDRRRLQGLELYCDGIAILTLIQVGVEPARLTSGIEKIGRFNRDNLGFARNELDYPSLADRRRFAIAITRWTLPIRP